MTVPIVGVPRGGTTMVAAVVHALGIDIGPAADLAAFTFEDQQMNRDMGAQLAHITQRNRERAIWGWKDPTAIVGIRSIFFALRNPRIIIVFRDMLASIEGEMRFDAANDQTRPFSDIAQATINWWTDNMAFVTTSPFPMLLVSYERAIQMPDVFINDVATFLGIDLTNAMIKEAMARINTRGGYLKLDEQGRPVYVAEPMTVTVPSPEPDPPLEPKA